MTRSAAAIALLAATAAGEAGEPGENGGGGAAPPVRFVESRIDIGSDRCEYQFSDADGDGRIDLFVTTAEAGTRTLKLYRLRADGQYPAQPDFRMTVPPDVVAFCTFDLRPEPGHEVVLLTRSGIFSLTATRESLQGNLRRELAMPIFPDLPDPERLPCWRMVEDVDGDGIDELLVVSDGGLVALSTQPPGAPDGPTLRPLFSLPCVPDDADARDAKVSIGNAGVTVQSHSALSSFFPGARSSRPAFTGQQLLQRDTSFEVPALFDWNGDKLRDLVALDVDEVRVRLQEAPGRFETAVKSYRLPEPLRAENVDRSGRRRHERLKLLDMDGDGRSELVLTKSEGRGSSQEHSFVVVRRKPDGTPEEAASALLKLEGMNVDYDAIDVDHDGFLDVVASRVDVPTGITSLANVRLDTGTYLFHGGPRATLDRTFSVKVERTFRPEQLARVQETLLTNFTGDFDGDHLNDLVLTQLDGRVDLRRLRHEGGAFALDERPLASFQPPAPVERMETWDVSNDGVADLFLRHKRSFTLFVSKKEAAK
jgi:hypothetical protein